jgi:hypothetical protein
MAVGTGSDTDMWSPEAPESRPGFPRPCTSIRRGVTAGRETPMPAQIKDVDGRDKPGHDTGERRGRAHGPQPSRRHARPHGGHPRLPGNVSAGGGEDVDGRDKPGHDTGERRGRAHGTPTLTPSCPPSWRASTTSPETPARTGGGEDVDGRDKPGHDTGERRGRAPCARPSRRHARPRGGHPRLCRIRQCRRGAKTWMAGTSPAMTRASDAGERTAPNPHAVMPALVAGIHDVAGNAGADRGAKTWMAGTSPAMTRESDAGERTAPDNHAVMPALVAGIHDVAGDAGAGGGEDVDGRDKPGHDAGERRGRAHGPGQSRRHARPRGGHPRLPRKRRRGWGRRRGWPGQARP